MAPTEDAYSVYESKSSRKNWDIAKQQEKWELEYYQDDAQWIWYQPEYKYVRIIRKKGRDVQENEPRTSASISPTIGSVPMDEKEGPSKGATSVLNFGDYHDWVYGEILGYKPRYVSYICNESMGGSSEKKVGEKYKFQKNKSEEMRPRKQV